MTAEETLTAYLEPLEAELRRTVDAGLRQPALYNTMIRYHLGWVDEQGVALAEPAHGRGKRVRPLLLLLCAEGVGGSGVRPCALPAAAAVELLHNFSLIHDDIQDQSFVRRGRPAVWTIWGAANAINAGDALYTLAYVALHGLAERGVPDADVLRAGRLFAGTCLALTRGQDRDMAFERLDEVSLDDYLSMIEGKSASLIALCAQLGALVAGADDARQAHFAAFGRNLGLAFQIRDDILGIWGDQAITGKSARTDIAARKKTLPILYALERSQALRLLYSRADGPFTPAELERAALLVEKTGAKAFAEEQEAATHAAALAALREAQPAPGPAQALEALVGRLLGRAR